jgi:predicted small lipoprotein YifL
MKKFIVILITVIFALTLAGCGGNNSQTGPEGSPSGQESENPDAVSEELKNDANQVSLTLDKEAYQPGETMKLVIANNNPEIITFGRYFKIEQYKDEKWVEYPLDLAFTYELILLDPGKRFEQTVSLEKMETGRFRILKDLRIKENTTEFTLAKEFEIK